MIKISSEYFHQEGYIYPEKPGDINTFITEARSIGPDFRVYHHTFDYISSIESRRNRTKHLDAIDIKSPRFDGLVRTDPCSIPAMVSFW